MTALPEVPTEELLNFQDFPTNAVQSNQSLQEQVQIDIHSDSGYVSNKQLNEENESSSNSKAFWTLEYYQQFFDVDTNEVVRRLFASMNPSSALGRKLEDKPDLYGPFWITVTLIFTIAISGNMANYLQEANVHYHWRYDFHLVSYAATAIISYVCLVPAALWFFLKWSLVPSLGDEINAMPGILKIICLYGYSLFIYIPTSIFWTIQVNWFQWLLVIFAAILSGSVLLMALFPSLKISKHKLILALAIVACHLLLAMSFMLYFFHAPNDTLSSTGKASNVTKKD